MKKVTFFQALKGADLAHLSKWSPGWKKRGPQPLEKCYQKGEKRKR